MNKSIISSIPNKHIYSGNFNATTDVFIKKLNHWFEDNKHSTIQIYCDGSTSAYSAVISCEQCEEYMVITSSKYDNKMLNQLFPTVFTPIQVNSQSMEVTAFAQSMRYACLIKERFYNQHKIKSYEILIFTDSKGYVLDSYRHYLPSWSAQKFTGKAPLHKGAWTYINTINRVILAYPGEFRVCFSKGHTGIWQNELAHYHASIVSSLQDNNSKFDDNKLDIALIKYLM